MLFPTYRSRNINIGKNKWNALSPRKESIILWKPDAACNRKTELSRKFTNLVIFFIELDERQQRFRACKMRSCPRLGWYGQVLTTNLKYQLPNSTQ